MNSSSHFAYIGTYNPNGEGVCRVRVDPAGGALSQVTLVSNVPDPAQLTLGADGKTRAMPLKWPISTAASTAASPPTGSIQPMARH